jgi:hypothetical protein
MSVSRKTPPPLLVALALLLVLGGALAALMLTAPPETSEAAPGASPAAPAPTQVLLEIPRAQQKTLSCVRAGGATYELHSAPGEQDGTFVYTLTPGFPGFDYQQSLMNAAAAVFVQLSGTPLSDAPTAGQLAEFGLSAPQAVWTAAGAETATTLEVGGKTGLGDGYYARLDGGGVFILPLSSGDALLKSEAELRNLSKLPGIDTADPYATLRGLRLESAGNTYALRVLSEDELSASLDGLTVSPYALTEPLTAQGNGYYIEQQVLTPLASLAPSAVVEDHPADLARYGLDAPARLTLTLAGGDVLTLLVGADAEDGESRYVMYEGVDSVLTASGDYTFLRADYVTLMSHALWLENIDALTGVTFGLPSGDRRLDFHHTGEGETAAMSPRLDGVSISETNAKRLYGALLSIYLSEALDTPPAVGQPLCVFTLHKADGSQRLMKVYPYNERRYLVSLDDGPAWAAVLLSDVRAVEDKLAAVDRGEELPQS